MESSGTPTPPAGSPEPAATPPPPPPPAAEPAAETPGAGWRVLAVILALALAFACAVMVIAMADIGDTPTCADVRSAPRRCRAISSASTARRPRRRSR